MDNGFGFRGMTKVCPVCGKKFWCEDPKAWVYRVTPGGQVCTYGCLVRHRKEQERTEEELRRAKINPDALCFVGNLGRLMNVKKVNGAELPQTGDNSVIHLWIMLLCMSAMALLLSPYSAKRNPSDKKKERQDERKRK